MRRFALPLIAALLALALGACGNSDAAPIVAPSPAAGADLDASATLALVIERTEQLFDLDGAGGPEILLIDQEQLAAVLAELLADPELIESLRRDQAFYTLLGLIPPGTDLLSLNEELLNAGVAGLYRPEVDRLYVRLFGSFSALEEATASHEYAHYLQDAGYDLERMFEVVAGNRDAELALRALVEGDAFYVQQQYIAEHFNAVQLFGMSFGGILAAAEAPSIPYALTRQTTFVYLDGQRWIDELPTDGYERAEFYSNPPRATREILHPETYASQHDDLRVHIDIAVSELPAEWSVGVAETIGELMLTIWLQDLSARGAAIAADGWTGDALHVFHEDGIPIGFIAEIAWATSADGAEFSAAASTALDADRRYERAVCPVCAPLTWQGPAGVLQIEDSVAGSTWIAVAPSADAVEQLIDAVR